MMLGISVKGVPSPARTALAGNMRNFIFGVEDSLVSTVGLLSGVAAAGTSRHGMMLTGTVLIFVEAFSMAVGSFLSEHSTEEYIAGKDVSPKGSLENAVIMFFSYFASGFVPLMPYALLSNGRAFWTSILLSLVALFLLGAVSARAFKGRVLRSGLRMSSIGGLAIGLGVVIGTLVG